MNEQTEYKLCEDCHGAGATGTRHAWEYCYTCGRKGYHGPKTEENDKRSRADFQAYCKAVNGPRSESEIIRELESSKYPNGLPGEERGR